MSTTNAIPETLGKYQIRGVLGRGAMGIVYDGWDPVIGRRVAIKTVRLLDTDDPEALEGLERFRNEARAAGRLSHPNIVAVYDYGESDDVAFIVMEFIEGQSLKQRLDTKEPLPVSEAVRVMQQVLAGLQFSHGKGVVHRDIKPGNVMLTEDGQVKLADFGIARIESSVMTQAGTMLGTPAYMSPEQLMAQTVDARSDIYSAGVLLYQLLTGERPFEGGLTAIIHKALNTTPPRPSEISVTAPPGLDAVVARAMERRPADRYADAATFASAIKQAFEAPESRFASDEADLDTEATMVARPSRSPAPPLVPRIAVPPARPAGGSKRLLLGGGAVIVLGLAGGGAWFALRPSAPGAPVVTATSGSAQRDAAPSIVQPGPSQSEPETARPSEPAIVAPPVAPEDAASAPPAPMPVDVPTIREALSALALSARCALPRFTVTEEGGISVSGLAGAGAPEASLREAVREAAPGANPAWDVRQADGPYCGVFDVLRPIAQPGGPSLELTLKGDLTRLRAHDLILPAVKTPEFPSYLLVDYFSHDGTVAHLYPIRHAPNSPFSSNATLRLGTSAKDRLEVGPPYGTDVIVATASSVPLFPTGIVRDDETSGTYVPAWRAAIEAAQRRNAKVTGRALAVDTVER
nr:serine/threonine-protein kinase [uncultured Rhodopila sp.]